MGTFVLPFAWISNVSLLYFLILHVHSCLGWPRTFLKQYHFAWSVHVTLILPKMARYVNIMFLQTGSNVGILHLFISRLNLFLLSNIKRHFVYSFLRLFFLCSVIYNLIGICLFTSINKFLSCPLSENTFPGFCQSCKQYWNTFSHFTCFLYN